MRRRDFLRTLAGLTLAAGGTLLSGDFSRVVEADAPFNVYLTFDDGPFPNKDFKTGPTDVVLQILKDHGAQATFFLHGLHILPWHGQILAQYITDGHSVGNHLWSQGGVTTLDFPARALLAYEFLRTEARIREVMGGTDAAALARYLQQPRLFRRPGGSPRLNEFLQEKYFDQMRLEPLLKDWLDKMDWLKGVFDYSGWHINGGESIPLSIRPTTPDAELKFILNGGNGYYGIKNYLSWGTPPRRTVEADQGLIILMHDYDKDTDAMLPDLLTTLTSYGAQFRRLPRPLDKPNTKTVGISIAPTVNPLITL